MRLTMVTGTFPPIQCGVGDYTSRLVQGLAAVGGVLPTVLTSTAADGSSGEVEVRATMPDWRVSRLGAALKGIRETEPDLVHIQFPTRAYGGGRLIYLLAAAARWRLRVPVVLTLHESLGRVLSYVPMLVAANQITIVRSDFAWPPPFPLNLAAGKTPVTLLPTSSSLPRVPITQDERRHIRARFLGSDENARRLVVYFGFLFEHRGVHQVFDIADPDSDHIVIIGGPGWDSDTYLGRLRSLCDGVWAGHAEILGFVEDREAARLLACADVVVLPFRNGGGPWNTSVLAARSQGTAVVMTSAHRRGYDRDEHTYYAAPNDINAMREAMRRFAGDRRDDPCGVASWSEVASRHVDVYRRVLSGAR